MENLPDENCLRRRVDKTSADGNYWSSARPDNYNTKIGISTGAALNMVKSMAKENIHGQIEIPLWGNGKMVRGRMVREHSHGEMGRVTLENFGIVKGMGREYTHNV